MISVPVEALDFLFVSLELIRAHISILRVYINNENGVTVDYYADVSYQVSVILDFEDPISVLYNLEISSPGLKCQLCIITHYQCSFGKKVKI